MKSRVPESTQTDWLSQYEEKLRQEHEINASLMNTARCIILYLKPDATIANFNPFFEEISGYKLDAVKGRNWFELCIPDVERPDIEKAFNDTLDGINTDGYVNAIVTADKNKRTIIWSSTRILGKDGETNFLLSCGQDITDRKFAQDHLIIRTQQLVSLSEIASQALQEPRFERLIEYVLRYIINSMAVMKAVYIELEGDDISYKVYSCAKKAQTSCHQLTLTAIPPDCIAMQALTLNHSITVTGFHTDDQYGKITGIDEHLFKSALAAPVASNEFRAGALCVYSDTTHVYTDEEVNYLQSVAHIISIVVERNRTQSKALFLMQESIRLSRINLVGELGTHIAHELNQPLTALMNYLQSCKKLMQSRFGTLPESIDTLMEKTLLEAERASSIIRNIRDYLESGHLHKTREDMNQVIEEVCDIIASELAKKKITLGVDLQTGMPPVDMDKLQIQQVLISIIHHSISEMEADTQTHININSSCTSANMIKVTIHDTGSGIDPTIFDSRFPMPPGSGQRGLYFLVCKSIIDAHQGVCWFSQRSEEGTVFNFTLPANVAEVPGA